MPHDQSVPFSDADEQLFQKIRSQLLGKSNDVETVIPIPPAPQELAYARSND
jgi:hypothetical protein